MSLAEAVARTISRFGIFMPGQRVGVGVSGGADSVCLLHILNGLAPVLGISLEVLHVDHGLRGEESKADAAFVRELARRLALPVQVEQLDLSAGEGNLEQAARNARRRFFQSAGFDWVALGHTRSDQAETVLFRLLRGSGLKGLAGMRPVTSDGFVRPLLECDRQEVEAWLRERSIPWREDSTNRDRTFVRNRIRHELLPALGADYNPRIVETLATLADLARGEEEFWEREIDRLAARILKPQGSAVLVNSLDFPVAVQRRLLRRAIQMVKGNLRQIEARHIESIVEMARRPQGHGCVQIPGVEARRSFDMIRLAPPEVERAGFRLPLSVPGRHQVPGSRSLVCLELVETKRSPMAYGIVKADLDWQRICNGVEPAALELRNWNPGDQYRRVGHSAAEKIKAYFQESAVPLWERRNWPIIINDRQILWARQFGAADEYQAGENSSPVLRVWEESGD